MEICVECGKSVKFGSGRFVNRIPVCDDYKEKVAGGRPFPKGEYMCAECEEIAQKEFDEDKTK